MTQEQREQRNSIEKRLAHLSFGTVTHNTNLKDFPNTKHAYARTVPECYEKPSNAKKYAELDILNLYCAINRDTDMFAIDYTVLSYNCTMFTCGFVVKDSVDGDIIAYYYFTKTRSDRYEF